MKVSTASLIHGILYVDTLCMDIEKLLQSNVCTNLLKDIQNGMASIRFFLQTTKENHLVEDTIDHREVQDVIKRCLNISYGAVVIIDNIVENEEPSRESMQSISNLLEQIKHANVQISKIFDNGLSNHQVSSWILTPWRVDSSHLYENATSETMSSHLSLPNAIMGFEEELCELKEMLMGNPCEFDVISIIGMPGLGKTTMAQELYKDKALVHKFDVRLWCTVSLNYNKKELLRQLLSQFGDETKDSTENDVRRKLLGKKFFIVLDDVWTPMTWEDIKPLLPMQNNGSRIVLTSRNEEVARSAKCHSEPYVLTLRSPDQSWEILKKAVFKNSECPTELEDIGRTIATKCRGLPLTTVLVAGLLNRAHQNRATWLEIGVNVTIRSTLEDVMSAIEHSYRYLPDHIKLCFLYLATFPEDEQISVGYLLSMWTAHKFVPLLHQTTKGANFTDKAEACLQDLISSNLVMVHKSKSFKEFDKVEVHDLIHEFCLKKAEQENFLCLVSRSKFTRNFSLVCNLHCQMEETRNIAPTLLYTEDTSILKFDDYPKVYYSKIAPFIQIITVLEIETSEVPITFLDRSISQLIHLRYLAVRFSQLQRVPIAEAICIPSSIAKLRKLETLILEAVDVNIYTMIMPPTMLFEMTNLRHLRVRPDITFPRNEFDCDELVNLETLSRTSLCPENLDIIYQLPNLRNLTCRFKGECRLSTLETPRNLEYLEVRGGRLPMCLLSNNLRELCLYRSTRQWSEFSPMIFPNLEVLYLYDAFEGETWEANTASFPSLKYLKL